MSKPNCWINAKEYQDVLSCLLEHWGNEPDEEFVAIDMYFKHKDGREYSKNVIWHNPDMTFEAEMALQYRNKIEGSGLKLGYVAEQMGISRQTLWAKLNGKSRLTVEDQLKLTSIITKGEKDHA